MKTSRSGNELAVRKILPGWESNTRPKGLKARVPGNYLYVSKCPVIQLLRLLNYERTCLEAA